MDLNYNIEKVEKIVEDLLRKTLEKKGNKGVSRLIDDIMNERPLDIDKDVKEELESYSADTLRLVVEKNILLSLENEALANRKSYWDVLKTRAPRIKQGIMSHYYDNYINFLKQENPATYQARTITELKETYNKIIGENISVINEMGNAVIDSVSSIDVKDNEVIKIDGEVKGKLVLNRRISNGKFVNRDEFIHLIDALDGVPNSKELITSNPNLSLSDLKVVASNLSRCLNVKTNETNEKEVTLGQAGIQTVGEIDNEATLPDGTYISLEELSLAVNKYINRSKEEEKPLKVVNIKQKIKKKAAIMTMSVTLLTAALPALKKNIETNEQKVVTQIDNSLEESNVTMVTEQMNNAFSGMANATQSISEKAVELGNATMDAISNAQETINEIVNPVPDITEVVEPMNEINNEETSNLETISEESLSDNESGVGEENTIEQVPEIKEEPIVEETNEIVENPIEETNEIVENNNQVIEEEPEERLATSSDFSFKFDESNEIAAAARNRGFTDDQIKMAVAISRQETGNYTSSAFLNKNNYGGMMTKNYEPMDFATKEEGLDKFLTMLQDKYFGQGLNTLEEIGSKYDKNNSAWPAKVQATLENDGLESKQETVEEPELSINEEKTETVVEEEKIEDVNKETPVLDKIPTAEFKRIDEQQETVNEESKVDITKNDETSKIEEVIEPIKEEKTASKVDKVEKEDPKVEKVIKPIKEEIQTPVVEQSTQEPVAVEPIEQPVVQTAPTSDTAAILGLTPQQLDIVKATIRHEAGNNPTEIANVASCIKNRMNNSGSSAYAVTTAPGQFESYLGGHYKQYTNGNYYQGDPATAAQVDAMMDAILTGTMAPTHDYLSFRSNSSPNGVQLTEGGNKYR